MGNDDGIILISIVEQGTSNGRRCIGFQGEGAETAAIVEDIAPHTLERCRKGQILKIGTIRKHIVAQVLQFLSEIDGCEEFAIIENVIADRFQRGTGKSD